MQESISPIATFLREETRFAVETFFAPITATVRELAVRATAPGMFGTQ